MKPSHTRLTCRAHNRFSPSIALWQHFVGRDRPFLTQQRPSSTVSQHGAGDHVGDSASRAAHDAEDGDPLVRRSPLIRRLKTDRGDWHPDIVDASIAQNIKKKRLQFVLQKHSPMSPMGALAAVKAAFDVDQDYKGIAVEPMVHPTPVKESEYPWSLSPEERGMLGFDRLSIEIERFCAYSQPSHYETIARDKVIGQVKGQARKLMPHHVLEIFGSERTGLALATSDIDLRLVKIDKLKNPVQSRVPPTRPERDREMKKLHILHDHIKTRHKSSYLFSTIRYARYPLISLQDIKSGLDIQIVLSNDTSLSRDLMKGYMEQYPYLRQLYFVVKTMFDVRGLTDVFRGGLGSYTLFMMIVASLRHSPNQRGDVAGGLINFMKFYRDLDTTKQGLSIEPVEIFDKSKINVLPPRAKAKLDSGLAKPLPAYMLCLRDPADPTNDLGRKAVAIKHVQQTLKVLLYKLAREVRVNTRVSLLDSLVGSSYMLYKERRDKLAVYGKQLVDKEKKRLAVQARQIREAEGEVEAQNRQKESQKESQKWKEEDLVNMQENIQLYLDNIQQELDNIKQDAKLSQEAGREPVLEHGDAHEADAPLQEFPVEEANSDAEKPSMVSAPSTGAEASEK